jgi:hypothetical protein
MWFACLQGESSQIEAAITMAKSRQKGQKEASQYTNGGNKLTGHGIH